MNPEEVKKFFPGAQNAIFEVFEGKLTEAELLDQMEKRDQQRGRQTSNGKYFHKEGQFSHINGKTYVLCNQWGTTLVLGLANLRKLITEYGLEEPVITLKE